MLQESNQGQIKIENPWMPCPNVDVEFPGLAYIRPLEGLIVTKKQDPFHNLIGVKGTGYTVLNTAGQRVFIAVQNTGCKKFDVKIFNVYGNEVIQVRKPFTLCCLKKILVWSPPGNFVGSVIKSFCTPHGYSVTDAAGNEAMRIRYEGRHYNVLDANEMSLGTIEEKSELRKESQNLGVSFPATMEIGIKAVLLGACFLIGF